MSRIMQWLCGFCGEVHGWSCPYVGTPGDNLTDEQRQEARLRLAKDRAEQRAEQAEAALEAIMRQREEASK